MDLLGGRTQAPATVAKYPSTKVGPSPLTTHPTFDALALLET